ncbi:MAG TPA: substrate-binding domain-containing protein, partial [Pseudomonadales bacterium]|nr:substrate-binding domain-containing protein [Pseudomonadales bacterium]
MNYWLAPPVAPLHLRTKEEEHKGMQEGRRAPAPEFLQPPLDSGLPMFTPQLPRDTTASFVGGASDILPQLVGAWIDAFNQYYPNVRIEIGKPYAGSLGMLNVIKGTYDFVFVSRELKPTDVTSFHARYGYDPLSIPVSGATWRHYGFLDAIGVFVNVSNPVNGLTLKQIDGIFSRSRLRGSKPLRTWGDV